MQGMMALMFVISCFYVALASLAIGGLVALLGGPGLAVGLSIFGTGAAGAFLLFGALA